MTQEVRITQLEQDWLVEIPGGFAVKFSTKAAADEFARARAWISRPCEIVWLAHDGKVLGREKVDI